MQELEKKKKEKSKQKLRQGEEREEAAAAEGDTQEAYIRKQDQTRAGAGGVQHLLPLCKTPLVHGPGSAAMSTSLALTSRSVRRRPCKSTAAPLVRASSRRGDYQWVRAATHTIRTTIHGCTPTLPASPTIISMSSQVNPIPLDMDITTHKSMRDSTSGGHLFTLDSMHSQGSILRIVEWEGRSNLITFCCRLRRRERQEEAQAMELQKRESGVQTINGQQQQLSP